MFPSIGIVLVPIGQLLHTFHLGCSDAILLNFFLWRWHDGKVDYSALGIPNWFAELEGVTYGA